MRPGEMVTSKANIGVGQVGLLIPIYTGTKRKKLMYIYSFALIKSSKFKS